MSGEHNGANGGSITLPNAGANPTIGCAPEPWAGLTEGRVVHFVIAPNEHRPATVVRAWRQEHLPGKPPTGLVNLVVLIDGQNDAAALMAMGVKAENVQDVCARCTLHSTSVAFDPTGTAPRSWHWPERT